MSTTLPEREAFDVKHTKGYPLILTLATTANGEAVTLPTEWRGRLVEFTAIGANAGIRFGASGVQVDMTTASGGSRPAVTAGTKEPHFVVPNGATRCERVPPLNATLADGSTVVTTLAHIGDAAGKLYCCLASGDGT